MHANHPSWFRKFKNFDCRRRVPDPCSYCTIRSVSRVSEGATHSVKNFKRLALYELLEVAEWCRCRSCEAAVLQTDSHALRTDVRLELKLFLCNKNSKHQSYVCWSPGIRLIRLRFKRRLTSFLAGRGRLARPAEQRPLYTSHLGDRALDMFPLQPSCRIRGLSGSLPTSRRWWAHPGIAWFRSSLALPRRKRPSSTALMR